MYPVLSDLSLFLFQYDFGIHPKCIINNFSKTLQANTPGVGGSSLTLHELQGWITAYRSFLKTNMGSFLLKSGRDDSLLLGDLHIVVSSLHGLTRPASEYTFKTKVVVIKYR